MKYIGIFGALVFILTLGNLQSVTIVSHHPDEEYFLEHEVLYEEAIAEAKKMEIYPAPIPGCKPCTDSEMIYCKDGSVISDHCCCDGSFNKVFPFVEHACHVGPEECKVRAKDCAEYTRLRECCCHSYLASTWKSLANDAGRNISTKFLMILTVLRLFL
ncbi:uncharacterized protein LOC114880409 isoform X1 [Osmia bicornis bicornis]|uniref:uncharacterized protein LOC114880409 isoform X1 n=1 Tax=Osmia bicornis bicornis TaxID=1437191 RepID=UPI0010F4E6D6|nr:uncharacterized protein LOC114880409 isoform X1 [Osmia bicornis bicornis]